MQSIGIKCSETGCGESREVRDWCKYHYGVLYRSGNLPPRPPRSPAITEVDVAGKRCHCPVHGEAPLRIRQRVNSTSYMCRICDRARKPHHKRGKTVDPVKIRNNRLRWGKIRSGWNQDVDQKWYESTLADQSGGCAICGEAPSPDKSLAVDHCHVTGDVRGLLCTVCNWALGRFKDDPGRFESAARYLKRF